MAQSNSGTAVVIEKFREFDRIATLLGIPRAERLGILNISDSLYQSLSHGLSEQDQRAKPELERRMSYALPLMRRLAGNSPLARHALASSGMKQYAA